MTHPSFSFTPDSPVERIETNIQDELDSIKIIEQDIEDHTCVRDRAYVKCRRYSQYRRVNYTRPLERSEDYLDLLRALYPFYNRNEDDENHEQDYSLACEDALVNTISGQYRSERRGMLKAKRKLLRQQNRLQERQKYIATLRQQLSLARLEPIKTVPVDLDEIHYSLSRHPHVTHIKSWVKDSDLYLRVHLNPMEMSNAGSCNCESSDDDCRLCAAYHDNKQFHIGTTALSFIWTPTSFQHKVGKLSGQRFKAYEGQHLVHPHWIGDDRPCLGDFGDSIATSQANGDLLSTILVYIEFLQSFNGQDCAGKYGWQWQKEYSNYITSVDEILPAEQTPTGENASYLLTTSNAHAYQGPQPLAIGA